MQLEVREIPRNRPPVTMNLNHDCYRFGFFLSFETSTTGPGGVDSACELELGIMKDPSMYIPQIVISHSGSNGRPSSQATSIASLGLCQSCATPNDEDITSLCGAAAAAVQGGSQRQCVGILSNIGDVKVRVCPRKGKLKMKPMELVTLQTLFNQPQKPSLRERLKLAVLLASSVMQLHETSWLNNCGTVVIFSSRGPMHRISGLWNHTLKVCSKVCRQATLTLRGKRSGVTVYFAATQRFSC